MKYSVITLMLVLCCMVSLSKAQSNNENNPVLSAYETLLDKPFGTFLRIRLKDGETINANLFQQKEQGFEVRRNGRFRTIAYEEVEEIKIGRTFRQRLRRDVLAIRHVRYTLLPVRIGLDLVRIARTGTCARH